MTLTFTDPYADVEKGIADRLRSALKLVYFTNPQTSTVQDWQVSDNDSDLHRGADYFIITRPGAFSQIAAEYKSGEIQTVDWETYLRLYVKYFEKADQWSLLKPFRAAVLQVVMKYRFLDSVTINGDALPAVNNVDRVRSLGPTEPAGYFWLFQQQASQGLPPNFLYQPLRVVTRQRVRYE
jgi:hypothetical protein